MPYDVALVRVQLALSDLIRDLEIDDPTEEQICALALTINLRSDP